MSARLVLVLAPIAALALAGCSDLPISRTEQVYQVVNAVDWAQTVNIARRPDCYKESGWPTEFLIGAHPRVASVAVFGVAQAVAHAVVSTWLEHEGWTKTLAVWQVLTIGNETYNVVNNARIGERPFGDGSVCDRSESPLRMRLENTL
jgi:hypothetical protein